MLKREIDFITALQRFASDPGQEEHRRNLLTARQALSGFESETKWPGLISLAGGYVDLVAATPMSAARTYILANLGNAITVAINNDPDAYNIATQTGAARQYKD